jgi:hypothetical protein
MVLPSSSILARIRWFESRAISDGKVVVRALTTTPKPTVTEKVSKELSLHPTSIDHRVSVAVKLAEREGVKLAGKKAPIVWQPTHRWPKKRIYTRALVSDPRNICGPRVRKFRQKRKWTPSELAAKC